MGWTSDFAHIRTTSTVAEVAEVAEVLRAEMNVRGARPAGSDERDSRIERFDLFRIAGSPWVSVCRSFLESAFTHLMVDSGGGPYDAIHLDFDGAHSDGVEIMSMDAVVVNTTVGTRPNPTDPSVRVPFQCSLTIPMVGPGALVDAVTG